ncbi:TPA: aminotransferase class I/II-fold pyridoxal phosphate-dependent enzyme [bacterium]|nr:aminotransferase class I/II-fold pyridoxal phosphate-dependent enzyme [bacterium]
MSKLIDLRSDTVTKPTQKMREAMMNAEVGDDCYGEDPTVNRLEEIAAKKIGKESAMFVPTGTMGNTSALMTHVRHGDAVIMEPDCHIYYYERGNVSAIAGALPVLITGDGGCPDPELVEDAIQRNGNRPKTTLICLENTHNRACGRAIPVEKMKVIQDIAKKYGIPIHLDGARIFNAGIALGVDVKDIADCVDSVMFCLSKGLGAPIGSMLAGTADFIKKARIARKRLGGSMRQAGVIASAGIIALEEMTERLKDDHDNAKFLADELSKVDKIAEGLTKGETNMVMFDTKHINISASDFAKKLLELGIKVSVYGPYRIRLVTHKDVDKNDISIAIDSFREIIKNL